MEAVAEQTVVRPVGHPRADGGYGNEVYKEHNRRENRQRKDTVCNDFINLIRNGKSALILLFEAVLDDSAYVDIALVCDNALRVVVHFLFRGGDIALDVRLVSFGHSERFVNLAVALE